MASFLCIVLLALSIGAAEGARHDYGKALTKSILFYEAQRSGKLPGNQRVNWRADSALNDGKEDGVDLVGGYYDAGDNVKFGLPMAFTITMLSWSVIEYGRQLASSGELGYTFDAIKWGTDYLLKAHPEPDVLYGEVGDGNTDHYCWQRPEDMTTSRQAYRVDANNPGSDLAGETAAAMAAASIVFRHSNPAYAKDLLNHATQLFQFADKYRGKYDTSIPVVQKFYGSKSGYADELLWAAAWLHEATGEESYLDYMIDNAESLGGTGWAITEFSWDVKYAGVQILASKFLMRRPGGKNEEVLKEYQEKAEYYLCACLQKGDQNVQKTPGGLLFWQNWNNIQFVTTASFLMLAYSDYLSSSGNKLECPRGSVQPSDLVASAQEQIDYILGDNPRATSYMVGYGSNYPRHVHHRASSIVSYKVNPTFVNCRGGYATWFSSSAADPNLLEGALVGGPDQNDDFADERDNYEQTEPATYNNGPLVGALARLHVGGSGYNQLLPVVRPAPGDRPRSPSPSPPERSQPKPAPPPVKQDDSPLAMVQWATSSWFSRGRTYHKYTTVITNKSRRTVKNIDIQIRGLYGPIWGVSRTRGSFYGFPPWLDYLAPGQSFDFVYIHAAPQANIQVHRYYLK